MPGNLTPCRVHWLSTRARAPSLHLQMEEVVSSKFFELQETMNKGMPLWLWHGRLALHTEMPSQPSQLATRTGLGKHPNTCICSAGEIDDFNEALKNVLSVVSAGPQQAVLHVVCRSGI